MGVNAGGGGGRYGGNNLPTCQQGGRMSSADNLNTVMKTNSMGWGGRGEQFLKLSLGAIERRETELKDSAPEKPPSRTSVVKKRETGGCCRGQ